MSELSNVFGNGGFDTRSVEPQGDYEVLPPGDYLALIEKAEVKQTKAATGFYLKLTLCVLDGPCKGRKLFDNINIRNQSKQCEEIGLRCLAAVGQAAGVMVLNDENLLINRAVIACVKVKDNQNEVRTYKIPVGQTQVQATYAQPPSQSQYVAPMQQPVQDVNKIAPAYQPPQTQVSAVQNQSPVGNKPPWAR